MNKHVLERLKLTINSLFQVEQGTGSSPEPQIIYGLLEGQNYKFKIKKNKKWLKMDVIKKVFI
jgi:hypothetical protein